MPSERAGKDRRGIAPSIGGGARTDSCDFIAPSIGGGALADPCDFLLRDAASGRWLRFACPARVVVSRTAAGIPAALQELDRALAEGRWVAGLVAYEASPGFDPALRAREDPVFPAFVFGVYAAPREAEGPLPPEPGSFEAPRLRATATRAQYARALESVRRAIREGDTYQVNFTYRLRGRFAGDPWMLFRHLAAGQGAPYGAYARVGPWVVASASPELFFRRDGDRLTSRPMKGTAARGRPGADDRAALGALLASAKERAENLMIVDMVRSDLSRVSRPGSVVVPDLFTPEAYPTVWQLTSLVEGRTALPLSEVLRALFPPASITGAPKAATTGIIARLESTPRRIYTGTIGFAAPGGPAQFNVAIRSALVDTRSGRFEYGVGGGIVWDSEPERERQESLAKALILRRGADPFELLETLLWEPGVGCALLEAHLARMAASARELGFRYDAARVRSILETAAAGYGRAMRVRLTCSRDGVPRVEAAPLAPDPAFDRPRLAVAPACASSADPLVRHKTTRREPYDRMRALCPGTDDVILWNERGEATETTWSNLFVETHEGLLTPPVECGLIPGTMRASLLAAGRARERRLTPDDVVSARRVWLANAVRGLYEAGSIRDDRPRRVAWV